MGDTPKVPTWLEAYRQPGHEIKKIKGNYYLYERRTEWDPEAKRSKKVSGAYRGRLTPEGIVAPKHPRPHTPRLSKTRPRALEYGASRFILQAGGPAKAGGAVFDMLAAQGCTPNEGRTIYLSAILGLCGATPDTLTEAYERSYLSEDYPETDFPTHSTDMRIEDCTQELRLLTTAALRTIEPLQKADLATALFDLAGIMRVYYAGTWHTLASTACAGRLCRALGWDFEN